MVNNRFSFLLQQHTGTIHAPKLGQGKKSVGIGIAQDELGLMTLTVDDNNGNTVDRFIGS